MHVQDGVILSCEIGLRMSDMIDVGEVDEVDEVDDVNVLIADACKFTGSDLYVSELLRSGELLAL